MAISLAQLVGASTAGAYATTVSTAPWLPAPTKVYIARAFAYQVGNSTGALSLSGNGITWIRLADEFLIDGAGGGRVAVFCGWSASASPGVTTLTSTNSDQLELRIFEVSGARLGEGGFSAVRQCVVGFTVLAASSLTIGLPLTPLGQDHLVLALCDTSSSVTFTPEGGWTELYDTGKASAVTRTDTSDASIVFTPSGSCAMVGMAIELYADTAATETIVRTFGRAYNPVQGYGATLAENSTTPVVVAPPVGMLVGDLVVLAAATRDTSGVTMAMSATGGQTWAALSPTLADTFDTTYPASVRLFWCRFDGTWSADPSVSVTGGTAPHSALMTVYRPPSTATTWAVHQALAETDFTSGTTRTVPGQATTVALAVQVVVAGDSITAGDVLIGASGAGWAARNSVHNTFGSDLTLYLADRVVAGAGAAQDVDLSYYGGGAAMTSGIVTFEAQVVVGTGASITLDPVTLSGAADVTNVGALAATLDPITLAAFSAAGEYGTLAATLANVTLAAVGQLDYTAAPPVLVADYPKLEGRMDAPPDGYRMTVNGVTVIVLDPGASYWPTSAPSFLARIAAQLRDWLGGTWTVSVDDDADPSSALPYGASGRITMAWSGGVFTVAWPDMALRDLLGYVGPLSGASSYTATYACPYVWLPNQRRHLPPTPEGKLGFRVADVRHVVSPSGHSRALAFGVRYESALAFAWLAGRRTWRELEVIRGESLESFFAATIDRGAPVRYHHDRGDDTTYVSWRVRATFRAVVIGIPGYSGRASSGADSYWHVGGDDGVPVYEYREE